MAQVPESHCFWAQEVALITELSDRGRPRRYPAVRDNSLKPLSARQWQIQLNQQGIKWRKVKLRLASKASTLAIAIRVKEVMRQTYYRPGKDYWLIIEKQGKDHYKYYVSNASAHTPLKKMMLWAHERWKIEQGYQQLKEELGLDHFEGRSWRGLHQHMTLCFMAYAFLLLLQNKGLKKIPQSRSLK